MVATPLIVNPLKTYFLSKDSPLKIWNSEYIFYGFSSCNEQIENEEVIHENLADEQVPVFRAKFDYVRKDRRERVFILESTIAAIVSCKKNIILYNDIIHIETVICLL